MNTSNFSEFFELLNYSNELKSVNDSLKTKNPVKFEKLFEFLVILENNLHLKNKDLYLKLLNDFLNQLIDTDDFSMEFMGLYENINSQLIQLELEPEKNETLFLNLFATQPNQKIARLLALIYGDCDNFGLIPESKITDEIELRQHVQEVLTEFENL